MRTARLTTFIAPFLLTATAAVAAVEGSVVGGAAATVTEVRATATDDTPWPRLSLRPAAVASDGDTPWPRLSSSPAAVASDGDTPWPVGGGQ
ncbi:hypothetical protein ACIQMR_13700 [Streptomyces sp. NPDC091376]|uniref:hypothetical protein n=1 Tax=Streptomyces sp. NPDC091376 TaxID=3365994 RepID=UPI00382671BC